MLHNKNSKQVVVKNTVWLGLGRLLSRSQTLILLFLVGRFMGPTTLGYIGFALSFGGIIAIFSDFGISVFVTYLLARSKESVDQYQELLIVKLLIFFFLLVVLLPLSLFLDHIAPIYVVVFVSLWLCLSTFVDFFTAYFRGYEEMEKEFLVSLVDALMFIAIVVSYFLIQFELGVMLFWMVIGKLLIVLGVGWFVLRKQLQLSLLFKLRFNLRDSLKELYPYGLSNFAWTIYYKSDVIILGFLVTTVMVGFYSVAYSILSTLLVGVGVFTSALLPTLTKGSVRQWKRFRFIFILGVLVSVVLFAFAKQIMVIGFGEEYLAGVGVLKILAFVVGIKLVSQTFGTILTANGLQKERLRGQLIVALANIMANLMLIPVLGIMGAAFTTLFSELALLGIYYKGVRQLNATIETRD